MSRYSTVVLIFWALLLAGCAKFPRTSGLYQEPPAPWEVEQNNSRLRDIDNLIQKGRTNIARQQAEVLNPVQLTLPQQAQFNLLQAQIFLSSGEAELALKKLALVQPSQLSIADKVKYLQSTAFAHSLTGNSLGQAEARIALDEYLGKPSERKNNQAVILESLGSLPESSIRSKEMEPGFKEWLAAAQILASKTRNPAEFNDSLAKWRTANPNHPANLYMATVAKAPLSTGSMPDSIAVLLPESGPYGDAAKAIKAGFLAAHDNYQHGQSGSPLLHFYDTEKNKVSDLYQKALMDGAKLVVGPLNKNHIQTLASNTFLTVPVLTLNQVPSLNKANLYQFALSPVDDVAELTRRALADGHKRALILVPDNELGRRVSAYFTESWQALNGTVLDKQFYKETAQDYISALKKILRFNNISQGVAPSQALIRQDADVLFLSAYSKEGRGITSQLKSYQADGVAVYALPNIYSGVIDSMNDSALNGVTFCDTPWLFMGAYSGDLSMSSLRAVWTKYPVTYIRLIAMGLDAYHLAANLPTLNASPYAGATGNLSLGAGNRIQRNLMCARFAMGQPQILGFNQSAGSADSMKALNSSKPAAASIPP